jgi:ADP-heptose:LPS heptosyltransferase
VAVGPPALVALRALGLGDLLTAVPALRGLAAAFPGHRRMLATSPGVAPLLGLVRSATGEPCFTAVPAQPLGPLPAVAHGADVAVNLHGRGPQSHGVLRAARPRRLIAFAHPDVPGHAGPPWRAGEHEVERWCRLLGWAGVDCDPGLLRIARPRRPAPAAAHGATLLHPGAASVARRWPAGRWAAVARAERERGRTVLLTGSAQEAGLARAIAASAGLGAGAVLAGRTDVLGLAGLVAAAGRLVCGDTGVAHLATALGTPSVVLFGPTSPATWGPRLAGPHRILWAGRTGDPHATTPDPGLLEIDTGAVLAALDA